MQDSTPLAPVTIELDRTRVLRVDFNALVELEREGRSVMNSASWQAMKIKDVRRMLFLALRGSDPELTEKKVASMLHISNLGYALAKLTESWTASLSSGSAVPLEVPQSA